MQEEVDILIIGAGPSGAVAAAIAHKAGYKIKVVEKQKFPRFVIGESLLPKCMEQLEEAGFLEALKKENYQIKRGVRFTRNGETTFFNFTDQYTQGWNWTWQVPRAGFDKVMTDELERRGVDISFESSVIGVEMDESGASTTIVRNKMGVENKINARFIIDASGYGRVLPRLFGLDEPTGDPPRRAIYGHFTDSLRPGGELGQQATFLIHRKDVWAWVIPFSNGESSVGFVGDPDYLDAYRADDVNAHLRNLMNSVPYTQERFVDESPLNQAHYMKAFSVTTRQSWGRGFVITGNSADFIDPVFSSGVTFATESGLLAAKLVCRTLQGEHVDWDKEYVAYIDQGVQTFRTYVDRWYDGSLHDIFFYADNIFKEGFKQQICSVLAGYVWDMTNPFVNKKRERALSSVSKLIKIY